MQNIDFYYDFGSPKSYFVYKSLPTIAAKHNVKIVPKPVLLGGIFTIQTTKAQWRLLQASKAK